MRDLYTKATEQLETIGGKAGEIAAQFGDAWKFPDLNSYLRNCLNTGRLLNRSELPRSIDIGPLSKWIDSLREITDKEQIEKGFRFFFSVEEGKWSRSTLITGDEKSISLSDSYGSRLKGAKFVGDIHTHPDPKIPFLTSTNEFSETDVSSFLARPETLLSFVSTPGRTLLLVRLNDTNKELRAKSTILETILDNLSIAPTTYSASLADRANAALYATVSGTSSQFIRVYPFLRKKET
jgi:hypothetical protein